MTEQEMLTNIVRRFAISFWTGTMPNTGNAYIEADLGYGGISAEFDTDGKVIDLDSYD